MGACFSAYDEYEADAARGAGLGARAAGCQQ